MGLLTDPSVSSDKSKYAKILLKYHNILCFALYLAGVIWFGLLADRNFNNGTYFSENALLPGIIVFNSMVFIIPTIFVFQDLYILRLKWIRPI